MEAAGSSAPRRAGLRIRQNQKAWSYLRALNSADLRDLNRVAVRDGRCNYTYGSLFHQWERYAAVFTALGMTERQGARVGILGSDCAEVIFAVYGLNMTGAAVSVMAAYSAFNPNRVMQTIRDEKLTDFIFTDDFAQPNLLSALLMRREELGLRNVIYLHVPMGGCAVHPMLGAAQEAKYRNAKGWCAPVCMDTLLSTYGEEPAYFAPRDSSDTAFILHTSGTTGGVGKPVVLSDRAFNAAVSGLAKLEELSPLMESPVSGLIVDLSNVYGLIDQVHLPLSLGGTVAVVPAGALNPEFYKAIPEFGITDLVITDMMVMPALWEEIQAAREELGLRNVILLHTRLGGPCIGPAELVFDEFNHHALRRMDGTVFMGDLLKQHESAPIVYGEYKENHIAVITHTSGSTKGTRKPLPYSNRAVNAAATVYYQVSKKDALIGGHGKKIRVAPSFDFSSFLCLGAVTNANLFAGNTVVLTFFGFLHPKFVRAVGYYKLNMIFTSGFMLDKWLENEDDEHMDFSSLDIFSCGGSYVPREKMKQYKEFAQRHGYRGAIVRGYGMSECGAVQILAPDTLDSDVLGFAEPQDGFRIQDENDQRFYRVDEGAHTGILYMTSDSHCENTLDGEKLFDFTEIDGRNFICTNDLVHVNEDGSFSYDGRADRYFVNNEGVRFDPGFVEVQMAAQPGIKQCAVVPVLDKRIHDTVPVLYVVPDRKDGACETVRRALSAVFAQGAASRGTNLPTQFVLVDEIPLNSNGKLDIHRITRERLQGRAYNIVPVREGGEIREIRAELAEQLNSITGGTLPEGMGTGSAFHVFDLFNPAPAKANPGCVRFARPDPKGAGKEKKPMQVPPELMQTVMDMQGLLYGQKRITYYFES